MTAKERWGSKQYYDSHSLAEINTKFNVTDEEFPFVLADSYAASEVERVAGGLAEALHEAKERLLTCGYFNRRQRQFGVVILRTINLALAAYNEALGKKD